MELWVLVPLAALAVGAFQQWLRFKAKQEKLGTSAAELTGVVQDLTERLESSERNRRKLEQRIQNIETIVTSQMWDIVQSQEGTASAPKIPDSRIDLPEDTYLEQEQAAEIARRLRNT